MKRAVAVGLFFVSIGMVVMMLLSNHFLGILFVALFLLLSYNLYCK